MVASKSGNNNAEAPSSHREQVVLIVDDEKDILESLRLLFETSLPGLHLLTAESGRGALEVLKKKFVDLIITDFKMPVMDGLQFLAEARKHAPLTPAILITAYPDLDLAIRAINEAKIKNFITKPMEARKVVDIVKEALHDQKTKEQRDQAFARSLEALRRRFAARP